MTPEEALIKSRGVLLRALVDIIEAQTKYPNATVKRMIGIAEDAIHDDPLASIVPEPKYGRRAKAEGQQ